MSKAEPFMPHLRLEQLHDVSGEDLEFEEDLFGTFKEQFEASFSKLADAATRKDKDNSVLYSHDIKGASRNIGADELGRVAKEAEDSAREAKYTRILEMLPQLREAFRLLDIAVSNYVASRKKR